MLDKDRFHNQLALNLGYQRIVNDKRINISIDDRQYLDDVMISISIENFSKPISYRASEGLSRNDMDSLNENGYEDIKIIVGAVHQAYIEANKSLAVFQDVYKYKGGIPLVSHKKRFNSQRACPFFKKNIL